MMMKMTINIVSLYLIKYDNDYESLLCVGGDATPRPHRYSLHSLYRGAAAAAFLGVAVVALRGGGGGAARLGAGAAAGTGRLRGRCLSGRTPASAYVRCSSTAARMVR